MIKHGAVIPGETPSSVSGKPSQLVKRGEAVRRGEEPADERKLIDSIPLDGEDLKSEAK